MAAKEDHARPDTHNADLQTRPYKRPHKKLRLHQRRNQTFNIRKKRDSVHHNRRAPHARITARHLLCIVEKSNRFPHIKINTLVIPPVVDQKPELWAKWNGNLPEK